jgi:hypothetical protein
LDDSRNTKNVGSIETIDGQHHKFKIGRDKPTIRSQWN